MVKRKGEDEGWCALRSCKTEDCWERVPLPRSHGDKRIAQWSGSALLQFDGMLGMNQFWPRRIAGLGFEGPIDCNSTEQRDNTINKRKKTRKRFSNGLEGRERG